MGDSKQEAEHRALKPPSAPGRRRSQGRRTRERVMLSLVVCPGAGGTGSRPGGPGRSAA